MSLSTIRLSYATDYDYDQSQQIHLQEGERSFWEQFYWKSFSNSWSLVSLFFLLFLSSRPIIQINTKKYYGLLLIKRQLLLRIYKRTDAFLLLPSFFYLFISNMVLRLIIKGSMNAIIGLEETACGKLNKNIGKIVSIWKVRARCNF